MSAVQFSKLLFGSLHVTFKFVDVPNSISWPAVGLVIVNIGCVSSIKKLNVVLLTHWLDVALSHTIQFTEVFPSAVKLFVKL